MISLSVIGVPVIRENPKTPFAILRVFRASALKNTVLATALDIKNNRAKAQSFGALRDLVFN